MSNNFTKKYIGNRTFYKSVLAMMIPMILQNLVTNFVSLIDNIMVGQIGTMQMNGVSIVNQFMFVFNTAVFGAVSGAGIFGAQFFGKGDHEGHKYTVRFRMIVCIVLAVIALIVFGLFDVQLISLFLSKDDTPEEINATLDYGREYMKIMLAGLIPFVIGQAYSSTVRECGETKIPMMASMTAVIANIFLDYVLIFGKFGFPEMQVRGAAIATVVSKFIEMAFVVIWVHTHKEKNKYSVGLYKNFSIPAELFVQMIKKGIPLVFNEFLWSLGMSIIAQCYSERGLDVVAARNISGTMTNLFSTVYIQLGACIGIIVGAKLGANKLKDARDTDNKLLFFSVVVTVIVAVLMLPVAHIFPLLYKTEANIRELASYMIIIQAIAMPLCSYSNACYFTLRSGGRTGVTFLFDFGYTWLIMIPLAYISAHFTSMDIHPLFAMVTLSEFIKVIIGWFMVKSDIWINNLVDN